MIYMHVLQLCINFDKINGSIIHMYVMNISQLYHVHWSVLYFFEQILQQPHASLGDASKERKETETAKTACSAAAATAAASGFHGLKGKATVQR